MSREAVELFVPEALDLSEGHNGGSGGQDQPDELPDAQETLAGRPPKQGLDGLTCEGVLPSPLLPPGESS